MPTPALLRCTGASSAWSNRTASCRRTRILEMTRYGEAGPGPEGSVMTVAFELRGQRLVALNGGPIFQFTPAVSFVVECDSQQEIDDYWRKLTEGGEPGQCGWLKDRYGVSWQVVPRRLIEMTKDPDPVRSGRVMQAMMPMRKLDLAALEAAYSGG
ncbi:MAG TPA: VOC family protein [Burkholderiaceae bacterium]|nr:VOC family protein [Burkholderiaceae bacterium]